MVPTVPAQFPEPRRRERLTEPAGVIRVIQSGCDLNHSLMLNLLVQRDLWVRISNNRPLSKFVQSHVSMAQPSHTRCLQALVGLLNAVSCFPVRTSPLTKVPFSMHLFSTWHLQPIVTTRLLC